MRVSTLLFSRRQRRAARRSGPLAATLSLLVTTYGAAALHADAAVSTSWGFTDATAEAGLEFTAGFVGGPTEVRAMLGGAAAGDVDGDGWIDLFVTRGDIGPTLLFRNRGDGTFEEVGAAAGVALQDGLHTGPLFADLDGDGAVDLFVGGVEATSPRVLRNRGDGTFTDVTPTSGLAAAGPFLSAAAGDYDRDGDLDVFVTRWGGPSLGTGHLWRNDGQGHFTDADAGAGVPLLEGVLDWTFTPTFSDVNGDGWPDLLLVADFGTSQLYLNDRDGTFTRFPIGPLDLDENGMGSAVGDFDNDGDLDWFVSSIWDADGDPEGNWGVSGNRLYRNRGDGRFHDATDEAGVRAGDWGWGSTFADFDNDGWLDLIEVNGWTVAPFDSDRVRLFRNLGQGTFVEEAVVRGAGLTGQGRGIVCFDPDADGDLDVFIVHNTGSPVYLRNDGGNAQHSLTLQLDGAGGNVQAIGARVTVTVGGLTQTREVRAGCNYLSQNPPTLHFGLGEATRIDRLRVVWPDGEVTVREAVPADIPLLLRQAPVPVVLSELRATRASGGVRLQWRLGGSLEARQSVRLHVLRAVSGAVGFEDRTPAGLVPRRIMAWQEALPVSWEDEEVRYRLVERSPSAGPRLLAEVLAPPATVSGAVALDAPRQVPAGLRLGYSLPAGVARARLQLFDVRGRRLRDWVVSPAPGAHALIWDRRDAQGRPVARGRYHLRLLTPRSRPSRAFLLLR